MSASDRSSDFENHSFVGLVHGYPRDTPTEHHLAFGKNVRRETPPNLWKNIRHDVPVLSVLNVT